MSGGSPARVVNLKPTANIGSQKQLMPFQKEKIPAYKLTRNAKATKRKKKNNRTTTATTTRNPPVRPLPPEPHGRALGIRVYISTILQINWMWFVKVVNWIQRESWLKLSRILGKLWKYLDFVESKLVIVMLTSYLSMTLMFHLCQRLKRSCWWHLNFIFVKWDYLLYT